MDFKHVYTWLKGDRIRDEWGLFESGDEAGDKWITGPSLAHGRRYAVSADIGQDLGVAREKQGQERLKLAIGLALEALGELRDPFPRYPHVSQGHTSGSCKPG